MKVLLLVVLILKLVIHMFIGIKEIQHIENGIHRNYGASDVPDAMLKDITPMCKAIR